MNNCQSNLACNYMLDPILQYHVHYTHSKTSDNYTLYTQKIILDPQFILLLFTCANIYFFKFQDFNPTCHKIEPNFDFVSFCHFKYISQQ